MLERIRGKAVLCLILTIFWVGLILIHNPHVTSKYSASRMQEVFLSTEARPLSRPLP